MGYFEGAKSFLQNLCKWEIHLNLSLVQTVEMFKNSGCSSYQDPSNGSSWCQC
jgi:hypothetical protein